MLTEIENHQLIELLGKLTWPVPPDVFDAICESFSVTPIELAVLRDGERGPEIFMIYRDDAYFKGWHITGSIIIPGRTVDFVLKDIITREVGISLTEPHVEFIRFRQFMKGAGPGQSRRSQEVSLIHVVRLPSGTDVPLDAERRFFPLDQLPEDVIAHHVVVLSDIREYVAKTDCSK